MTCLTCKTSAAPHELMDGKCLKCLHQENTILRLLVAHTIMTIEQAPAPPHPVDGPCYAPLISAKFVEHLKTAFHGVKVETSDSTKTVEEPPKPIAS